MAKNVIVVGTQWGDEGKGKIVDWLTDHAKGVVRFQGGHNAGHTLVVGEQAAGHMAKGNNAGAGQCGDVDHGFGRESFSVAQCITEDQATFRVGVENLDALAGE